MNLDPQTVMEQLIKLGQRLQSKNEEYQELCQKAAEAEKTYRIALAQKILELRQDGQSVSLTSDLARGDKHVAQLKYERDVAEGIRDACKDSIRDIRDQIEIMRSVLAWLREEYKNANVGG